MERARPASTSASARRARASGPRDGSPRRRRIIVRTAVDATHDPRPRGVPGPPTPDGRARLHPISRRHLGILRAQPAITEGSDDSPPDAAQGYSVDDVARALEVDLLHARTLGWPAVSESAWRNLRSLEDAFDESSGRFTGFRATDGSSTLGPGSSDPVGRTMYALGTTIGAAPEPEMVECAASLFDRALPKAVRQAGPRTQAAIVLGCAAAGGATRTDVMRTLGTDLHARFRSFARPGWPWPEDVLTYENALLPRAMIVAGDRLGAATMRAVGLQVLDWLIGIQTTDDAHLSPIGNGGWERGGTKSQFDQQPIEATSLLLAAEAALAATGNPRYGITMERAYGWFLGANDLGRRVADPARGAARDGLTAQGVDPNVGTASTLLWLIAAEHIRALRGSATTPPL